MSSLLSQTLFCKTVVNNHQLHYIRSQKAQKNNKQGKNNLSFIITVVLKIILVCKFVRIYKK